jgi:N-acetylmuramoyl-L-alanine amidase/putative methionine-R-sulfoxide reductase with GAF domain
MEPAFLATELLQLGSRLVTVDTRAAQLLACLESVRRDGADSTVAMDQLLQSVAGHARELADADGAAVAVLDAGNLVCRARAGRMAPAVGEPVNLRSRFSGEAFRKPQTLYCKDTESDPRVHRERCRGAGVRSILAVPVVWRRQAIGLVEVFSGSAAQFEESKVHALELLAGVLAEAVRAREAGEVAGTAGSAVAAVELPVEGQARSRRSAGQYAFAMLSAMAVSIAVGVFPGHSPQMAKRISLPSPVLQQTASPPPAVPPRGPGILLGVQHESRPDLTKVAIELGGAAKVSADHLDNPERIYFDFADTRVGAEFMDAMHMKAIAIGDRLVNRVRVAQRSEDVTRVVLDLNRSCEFTYAMSPSPPFQLTVQLRAAAGKATENQSAAAKTRVAPAIVETEPQISLDLNRPLRIVIDPGHGGWDIGSVGPTGLQEKDLVLDVAQRLSRLLRQRLGAEAILTRSDDTFIALEDRPGLANSVGADLFLSIHGNSSPAKNVRGVETYYVTPAAYKGSSSEGPDRVIAASRRLASAVQHALYTSLSGADPLLNDRGTKAAALSVLEAPTMPSVLTEISFVTSTYEEQKLRRPEYRDSIAEALFEGIKAYARQGEHLRVQSRAQATLPQGK